MLSDRFFLLIVVYVISFAYLERAMSMDVVDRYDNDYYIREDAFRLHP